MKKVILILMMIATSITNAQTDSVIVSVDTLEQEAKHFYEIDLLSRNIWRGIDFGNYSPTIVGVVGYAPIDGLEIGIVGIVSALGTNVGYGNTFNMYASYSLKGLTFTLDDYYFNGDVSNLETEYLDWNNTHFLEGRLKYEYKSFYSEIGYTLTGGEFYNVKDPSFDNTKGLYIEAGYESDHIKLWTGGITGPSALNFHDKAGIINIGAKYMGTKREQDFEIGVIYNPTFDYIAPLDIPRFGYGKSAFNFYVGLIF